MEVMEEVGDYNRTSSSALSPYFLSSSINQSLGFFFSLCIESVKAFSAVDSSAERSREMQRSGHRMSHHNRWPYRY